MKENLNIIDVIYSHVVFDPRHSFHPVVTSPIGYRFSRSCGFRRIILAEELKSNENYKILFEFIFKTIVDGNDLTKIY